MSQTIRERVVPLAPKTERVAPFPVEVVQTAVHAALADIGAVVSQTVLAQMPTILEASRTVAAQTAHAATAEALVGARLAASQGLLHAVAALLAIKVLLLLALLGGLFLAWRALDAGTYQAATVLGGYAVLIMLPLVWLEYHPRRQEKPHAE